MADRREYSTITPKYLWEVLHAKQGRSGEASALSVEILSDLDTQNFTNTDVAERHGEIAAIAMMTSFSAFKQARDWEHGLPFLLRTAQAITDHYPIEDEPAAAIQRGNYWDPVYGAESAQRITARHIAKFYDMMSILTGNEQLFALANGLKVAMNEKTVSSNEHARFELIGIIDKPTTFYKIVRAAYEEFMKDYGYDSPVESVDQIVTVTTKVLGRAFAEKDWKTVQWCLTNLKIALQKKPELWRFIVKELGKNFIPNKKEQLVDEKLRAWTVEAHSSEELLMLLTQLEGMVFLGLGHGEVIELQSTEFSQTSLKLDAERYL